MGTEAGVKLDEGKLLMSLMPHEAIVGLAEVMTFGANKYTPNGWKTVPNAKARYEDALLRHYFAYKSGEQNDPESGLSHLKHILTNVAFLIYFEENNIEDDEEKVEEKD
jgi:hypothetical protein